MALHLGDVVTAKVACASAPTLATDIVTAGVASGDGASKYFVYVLAAADPLGSALEVTGMHFGIEYDASISVFGWARCASSEYLSGAWPASGSGVTLAWPADECQESEVVPGGYFYVAAYDAGMMSITGSPQTGAVRTADCDGTDFLLDRVLAITEVGWVSFGGAAKHGDTDGCNPALGPCNEPPVAVTPTSWGRLKSLGSSTNR